MRDAGCPSGQAARQVVIDYHRTGDRIAVWGRVYRRTATDDVRLAQTVGTGQRMTGQGGRDDRGFRRDANPGRRAWTQYEHQQAAIRVENLDGAEVVFLLGALDKLAQMVVIRRLEQVALGDFTRQHPRKM